MGIQYEGYFEDLNVGEEFVSPGRTVTEADIVAFAGVSGDYNPLHVNAEYAKDTPFGARIAHGILGLAIASGLAMRIKEICEDKIVAFLGLKWKYLKPILVGDTVHIVQSVASKRETQQPDKGLVVFNMALINQRGECVQQGEWNLLFKRCPAQKSNQ